MKTKDFLESKNLVINSILLPCISKFNLSINEFLLLLYFINDDNRQFDVAKISNVIKIEPNTCLEAFNSLIKKKAILLESKKNPSGKICDFINLDPLYVEIDSAVCENEKEKHDIYTTFEKEFGRPLSSMEYEIIKAWISKDFSEEMILDALKEAVYNGVRNLRYIDKILFEWKKKGLNNQKDLENYLSNRSNKSPKKELFDYNWLDDENNE